LIYREMRKGISWQRGAVENDAANLIRQVSAL
jgi:hypothetical protein